MSTPSNANLTQKTVRGLSWNYLSHYSGKVLLFISTIILARVLTQDEYGVAGYAFVVISLLDIIADLGIGASLIYHRDDPRASSTAFWLGLLVGIGFFGLNWMLAPAMAFVFNDPRATDVIRILGLTFPLTSLSNIHEALLRKSLDFKRRFIPDITRSVSKGLFSVIFALIGFGAWSLVLGHLVGIALSVFVYWIYSPWHPSLLFSSTLIKPLLSYGSGIIAVNMLSILLLKIDYIFVGRYLGAEALGIYLLAFRVPELIILQFCGIVAAKVFFPLYASLRDEPDAIEHTFLMITRYMALIVVPLGLGMALVAKPMILVFFGEKWLDAVPVTQAIAIYCLFLSLTYNVGDIYKARGQTHILTKISIMRLIILLPMLWWAVTAFGTITAVGWAQAVGAFIASIINLAIVMYMLKLSLSQLFSTFHPALVGGALLSIAVQLALLGSTSFSPLLQLIIAIAVGALSYVGALWWLQRGLIIQVRQTIRSSLSR